ncbi:DEDD exonuclease domain-containing protein [Epidermidibacterium keratini]
MLGEFQTLVNPERSIEPYVQVLTGITDSMVAAAPTIDAVLPAFLEFAGLDRQHSQTIVVAHNARFDVGFLKAAASELAITWPRHRTLDTVLLARRAIPRDEVPNYRLESLAMHLGSRTRPTHRALDDARATVDVLHAVFERLGNLGVHSVDEALALSREVTAEQRRKRTLATDLPATAGVYIFRDGTGAPLYVGKSRNIRRRVRDYFTASEPRKRMREMVALAERVDALECAHDLEAQVRENRMIAALRPRYNRRSKNPNRAVWVKLTAERFPRLSVVSTWRDDDGCHYLGPFPNRAAASAAIDAIHQALPMRRCSDRITTKSAPSPCALAEIKRCVAPCDGSVDPDEYADVIAPLHRAISSDAHGLVEPLLRRIEELSRKQRYEDASRLRDQAVALLRALVRTQRIAGLSAISRAALAAANPDGSWDIAVLRYGRLSAAAHADRASSVVPIVEAISPSEQQFANSPAESVGTSFEETEILATWLERDGVRLVALDGELSCPVPSAAQWRPWLRTVTTRPGGDGYDRASYRRGHRSSA